MTKTNFIMADYNQNKNIVSALRTRNHQIKDSINITYGILDQIFESFTLGRYLSKANNPMLGYSPKKSENDIANIVKKPHNFVKKLKTTLKNHK